MKSNSRIFLSLLAGLGAGAVAGLLLAPKTGNETISDLSERTKGWKGQLSQQWSRLRGQTDNGIDKMERKRNQFVNQTREQLDNMPHRPRVSDIA